MYSNTTIKHVYKIIAHVLHPSNRLNLTIPDDAVPMVYPYWTSNGAELRRTLQQQRIYTATYWPNVLQWNSLDLEQSMALNLLPLPIDQRYTKEELDNLLHHVIN